jgi:hypothetical protein
VFEERVLRRIFGCKGNEVTGGWRKLHNEKLHNLYSSPNIIRMIKSRMRWAGYVARIGETRNAYKILVGDPEGKKPLRRSRRMWVDNIKKDHRKVGWGRMDWIDLVQNRDQWSALVNMVMNLRVHKMLGSSQVAAQLAASHEGFNPMKLATCNGGVYTQ